MKTLTIRRPDDFHVHLRRGDLLDAVLPHSARHFGRVLAMPNTRPPLLTEHDVYPYRGEILTKARHENGWHHFDLLSAIQITDATTPEVVKRARIPCVAGKLYPAGVTTNSDNGVSDIESLFPVFEAMQDCGMILCLHGEDPDPKIDDIDREISFMKTLTAIARTFPDLKIVLEHITDRASLQMVRYWPNVAATVTPHHLLLTMNDVYGARLQPHHFCKPTPKRFIDRDAILKAVLAGDPKLFLGTDSAPHPKETKECASGCAGVFNAPVALPLLTELFERHHALDRLEDFVSRFGAEWYGLRLNYGTVSLERVPWKVPDDYAGIVPLWSGRTIQWRMTD